MDGLYGEICRKVDSIARQSPRSGELVVECQVYGLVMNGVVLKGAGGLYTAIERD